MIITCPKCARKHKVNPDALKPFADAGKKNIMASCKSRKFKFPNMQLAMIFFLPASAKGFKASGFTLCFLTP